MKTYKTNEIKNLVLLGSPGSGKTTLAEAMLYGGGIISRRGEVTAKNTASDYQPIEQELGNSIFSTVLYTEINDRKINILDTPGIDDFVGAVTSSLNVADTGLLLIDSSTGIEAGTETSMRLSENTNTPLIFVANYLDHENSNFDHTIEQARSLWGNKVTIVQYPVNQGLTFNAVVDVLKMKMYTWPPEGGSPTMVDIPDSEAEKAAKLHNELVEKAAENEESLMELYFDKGTLTEDEMRQGMRRGMLQRTLFPVFCISAKRDMGIRRLMEFICNIVPAPDQMPMREKTSGRDVKMDEKDITSLFIFKSSTESHIGEILFFKVMSGVVHEGQDLINTTKGNKERIAQLFVVAGKNRTKVTELVAGDIGATVKLKETKHDHTLCDKDPDLKFVPINFPAPRYRVAIKAVVEADDEKVGEGLHHLRNEDPTYIIDYSKELKQLIVQSQGEYHMNVLKWYFDHVFKINIQLLDPKIPYRETITQAAFGDYRHKKQSGGSGQFGEVHLIIEPYREGMTNPDVYKIDGKEQKVSLRDTMVQPLPWGGKLVFCNCIVGGAIEARFLPAILKGIMEKMEEGPLTGSYARDIRVCVYDGKMHPVDSNEISFRLAGRHAFSIAFKNAVPKILEPIYDLKVTVPSDRMGDVMSDLQGRRALILGMDSEHGHERITAKVPLKEMNRYSTALSSITGGKGQFTMSFSGYEKVPVEIQEELLSTYATQQSEV